MGVLIWKLLRNVLYYGLIISVVAGAAYTGVIQGIYSIMLGTYSGMASFVGVATTNMIFGTIGILVILAVIGIFYERD